MGDERRSFRWTVVPLALVMVAALAMVMVYALRGDSKVTVGAVEEVVLVPWNVRMSARIDTGAAISSLDARSITAIGAEHVEFSLPRKFGGRRVRQAVVAWKEVRSSNGAVERRPVIRVEVHLGPRQFHTNVTLTDRTHMDYPLLIGRNTLEGRFIVDVTKSNITPPTQGEIELDGPAASLGAEGAR